MKDDDDDDGDGDDDDHDDDDHDLEVTLMMAMVMMMTKMMTTVMMKFTQTRALLSDQVGTDRNWARARSSRACRP